MSACPCGSGKDYEQCCGPLHRGEPAGTAEALMRSRYSAYAKSEISYLKETLHPKKRKGYDEDSVRHWADHSEWIGLEIESTEAGSSGDSKGVVQFTARYKPEKGEPVEHRERAEFVREGDRWYFYDGKSPDLKTIVNEGPKVGRNDPCPCGSGKKFKKCCGKAA